MSEHTIKNPFENIPQDKATYVVLSYYDQNDVLVSQTKFHICDGQPDNIQNLTSDEIKHLLVIHGIWPQYTKRIKNLERVEQILLSYDNQLGHLYDTLETINYETKKYDRKGKEIPRHLISHKLQTINLIGSINERKGVFQLQIPADESLRKTVEELTKKCQN